MLKAEIQAFFIVDTCKCVNEYDDPKDAILYFYPPQVSENYQCTLCCQLMGVVQFYTSFFSFPKTLCLESGKFVVKKCDRKYLFCLGGLSDTSDYLLSDCLDFMYGLFTFYHKSISCVYSHPDTPIKEIWNECVAAMFVDDKIPCFVVLPWLQTAETSLYLNASHIVQSCRRYPLFVAGCIFHNGEIVFTQLEPRLTEYLCCFEHFRSVSYVTCLPKDVIFANIYISQRDVEALMQKRLVTPDGGPRTTGERSDSVSEEYETPDCNAESEESCAETLDGCLNYQSSTETSEFFSSESIHEGNFCDSFQSSLTLIHEVTHNSLEKLNQRASPLKPRRKKKSIPEQNQGSNFCHEVCDNFLKQKRVTTKVKSNEDTSCDSSFFDSPVSVLGPGNDLAKECPGIVISRMQDSICRDIYLDICNNVNISDKTDSLDINSILTEKEILINPFLHFPKGSKPDKVSESLRASTTPERSKVDTQSDTRHSKKEIIASSFDSSSLRTVREGDSGDENDEMLRLALYVFRQSGTDLYLLMDDRASDSPSLIGEIYKMTEKCLKKLNESLVPAARIGGDKIPSKSDRSFTVDNCWRTLTGDSSTDDHQGVSWVALKEEFHLDPTLKCTTIRNLKGTSYAHNSVTHQVFSSVKGSYAPGIPDAQDALAKMSTLPKQAYDKMGYYLLR